jgi:hypothetical protein
VGGVTMGGLLNVVVGNPALCWDTATGYIRCQFRRVLGLGSATASVTLQAANVGRAFRGTLQASDITMTHSGTKTISSASIANSTSDATITINLTWPANLLILAINQVVTADIPHLQAARIHTDPRVTWFVNNNWHRYTWYAVSPDATANNSAWADRCDAPGDPGCLWVNNLAAAHGNTNDKQLVLVLSGLPLGTQSTPSADLTQYFEAQNASLGVVYQVGTTSTTFNDRVAMCPFKHVDHSNNDVVLCN